LLDFFDGADDDAALVVALARLADHRSCVGVEVHEAGRMVARLRRDQSAAL